MHLEASSLDTVVSRAVKRGLERVNSISKKTYDLLSSRRKIDQFQVSELASGSSVARHSLFAHSQQTTLQAELLMTEKKEFIVETHGVTHPSSQMYQYAIMIAGPDRIFVNMTPLNRLRRVDRRKVRQVAEYLLQIREELLKQLKQPPLSLARFNNDAQFQRLHNAVLWTYGIYLTTLYQAITPLGEVSRYYRKYKKSKEQPERETSTLTVRDLVSDESHNAVDSFAQKLLTSEELLEEIESQNPNRLSSTGNLLIEDADDLFVRSQSKTQDM